MCFCQKEQCENGLSQKELDRKLVILPTCASVQFETENLIKEEKSPFEQYFHSKKYAVWCNSSYDLATADALSFF